MSCSVVKRAIILLAEDDPGDQELIRRAFRESRFTNELRFVNDGEEVLDYLFQRGKYSEPSENPSPDLLLLDLNMPKMDGKEVIEKVRAVPELCSLPIVVLTTSQSEEDILRSYRLGANSYIIKPLTLNKFLSAIHKLESYWLEIVVLQK